MSFPSLREQRVATAKDQHNKILVVFVGQLGGHPKFGQWNPLVENWGMKIPEMWKDVAFYWGEC
jgi:hypothetical protein